MSKDLLKEFLKSLTLPLTLGDRSLFIQRQEDGVQLTIFDAVETTGWKYPYELWGDAQLVDALKQEIEFFRGIEKGTIA